MPVRHEEILLFLGIIFCSGLIKSAAVYLIFIKEDFVYWVKVGDIERECFCSWERRKTSQFGFLKLFEENWSRWKHPFFADVLICGMITIIWMELEVKPRLLSCSFVGFFSSETFLPRRLLSRCACHFCLAVRASVICHSLSFSCLPLTCVGVAYLSLRAFFSPLFCVCMHIACFVCGKEQRCYKWSE